MDFLVALFKMKEITPEEKGYTKWRPNTQIEAQLWNYANREFGNGSFFPIDMWPDEIVEPFLMIHKTNPQRFALVLFFAGNGLDSTRIKPAIFANFADDYDALANNHIDQLILKMNGNVPEHWVYYDVVLQEKRSLAAMLRGETLN